MKKFTADIIYTAAEKAIPNGIIVCDDEGVVLDVLNPALIDFQIEDVSEHSGIICPGFINCHCHFELSAFKGLIPQKSGLDFFIQSITELRKITSIEDIAFAAEKAITESIRNGVVAVADITNTLHHLSGYFGKAITILPLIEVFGINRKYSQTKMQEALKLFNLIKNAGFSANIIPHSLYSLSDTLLKQIVEFQSNSILPISLHFLESASEREYFQYRSGDIFERYKKWGMCDEASAFLSDKTDEISFLLNNLNAEKEIILVHNNYVMEEEISFIENHYKCIWWCLCPLSNDYISSSPQPLNKINKFTDKIVFGTDSLASNHTLNILEEIKKVITQLPEVSTWDLLKYATINGATCLKVDDRLGSILKGKKPGLNLITKLKPDFSIYGESEVIKLL